jgi:hypothetical protein
MMRRRRRAYTAAAEGLAAKAKLDGWTMVNMKSDWNLVVRDRKAR